MRQKLKSLAIRTPGVLTLKLHGASFGEALQVLQMLKLTASSCKLRQSTTPASGKKGEEAEGKRHQENTRSSYASFGEALQVLQMLKLTASSCKLRQSTTLASGKKGEEAEGKHHQENTRSSYASFGEALQVLQMLKLTASSCKLRRSTILEMEMKLHQLSEQ